MYTSVRGSWCFCPEQSWCAREGGRLGKRKTEEVKQKGYKEILGKGDIDCTIVKTVLWGRKISCEQLVRGIQKWGRAERRKKMYREEEGKESWRNKREKILRYYYYLLNYLLTYLLQLSLYSVAVILTLVQTKQMRINIHKRNNTKAQHKQYKTH